MEKQVRGVLLAVDEVTVAGRPWARLWVASGETREPVWLPNAAPALVVVPEASADLEGLAAVGRLRAESVEVVERRRGRSTLRVLRLVARDAGDLVELRRGLLGIEGVASVLEADIPIEHRVLVANDLRVMEGLACEVAPDWRVGGSVAAAVARSPAVAVRWRTVALAADIENADRNPDPASDRIRAIALSTEAGTDVFELGDDGDRPVLERFRDRFLELDPDFVLTWNGDTTVVPFLLGRAERVGVSLPLGRDGGEPEVRGAGPNRVASMTGRAHVDLKRVADRDLRFDVKVKTLGTVAEHLGIEADDDGTARQESDGVRAVGQALLPLQMAFARLTRLPVDEASRAGRGRQVEALLLGEAARVGLLVPARSPGEAVDDELEGGFVLDPTQGLHEDVVALDFGAMYPSIMIAYNVSPDTLVAEGEEPDGPVFEAPERGVRFLRSPDGFFRRILVDLVERRKAIKQRLRALPEGMERAKLDVEQASIKVLTNAMYGYTGWTQARWGSRPCAEATAAWGRAAIKWVIDEATKRGFEVLYSDTDSLFLRGGGDLAELLAAVHGALPLELDVAERYKVLLFTGAKKKYAGIAEDGRLVARGFEIRRGDWCPFARSTQERVLETVLRERDPQRGLAVAREAIERLRNGAVPLDDLTIFKTLTARPGGYRVKPMHAAAVERAEAADPGLRVAVGTKVGLVLVAGTGPASDRAVLASTRTPTQALDLEWYVEKQVAPAALRVLENFGFAIEDVKGAPKQRSLSEFF